MCVCTSMMMSCSAAPALSLCDSQERCDARAYSKVHARRQLHTLIPVEGTSSPLDSRQRAHNIMALNKSRGYIGELGTLLDTCHVRNAGRRQ